MFHAFLLQFAGNMSLPVFYLHTYRPNTVLKRVNHFHAVLVRSQPCGTSVKIAAYVCLSLRT
jgi:hypothetical protein